MTSQFTTLAVSRTATATCTTCWTIECLKHPGWVLDIPDRICQLQTAIENLVGGALQLRGLTLSDPTITSRKWIHLPLLTAGHRTSDDVETEDEKEQLEEELEALNILDGYGMVKYRVIKL